MVTSSEGFIAGEMGFLQAKLKKLFALDITDFAATKKSNLSEIDSIVNHPKKKNQLIVISPTTQIDPFLSEEFIEGEMAKMK